MIHSRRNIFLAVLLAIVPFVVFTVYTAVRDSRIRQKSHSVTNRLLQEAEESRELVEEDDVKLIWAMSFPQTGITGILGALHKSTGYSMATNYGNVHYNKENLLESNNLDSVPINPHRVNGPFKTAPLLPAPSPGDYVMVRTHCAGFCLECNSPRDYVLFLNRIDLFEKECSKSTKFSLPGKIEVTNYHSGLVKKIVWIMRNPWDTIVSRFKQLRSSKEIANDTEFLEKYTNNKEGFTRYCHDHDLSPRELIQDSMWYENDEFALAVRFPCRAEMYKVVKWHNQVYRTAKEKNIPYLVVHYEDFKFDFNGEMKLVHDFMETDFDESKLEPIELEGAFTDYFEQRDKEYATRFMQHVLEKEVFEELKRYVE